MIFSKDKDNVRDFLLKFKPIIEKVPDIFDKFSKLNDNKELKEALGTMGTIGGLVNIGLFIFDKALSQLSTTEKSCFSLMNKTAIDVANKLIKEKSDIYKIKLTKEKTEETLKELMKIYSFKETDENEYKKWNGKVPYDHPIVKQFKENIINILKENKLENQYIDFQTRFNSKFQQEIAKSDIFLKYQKDKALENQSDERIKYYSWILNELDKPNPIDHRKATDYYIKNRSIEIDVEDKINHKDKWNISDHEAESLYKEKDNEWKLEDFLNSR